MEQDEANNETDNSRGKILAACYRIAIERARLVRQQRQAKMKEGNSQATQNKTEAEKLEAIA